ncbi:unnamed protein product [Calicophoron daubneyi]|uniref:t-SNARE coiled-coil homology domain-containing protein n=1 Tax=Calicophoron daubneyi TaxID=300641 RepID=A0AAV2TT57_CALDB
MAVIIGACDRTGEFKACTRSYQQKLISGRASLRPHSAYRARRSNNNAASEFILASKSLSEDLRMTQTKLKKLRIVLEERGASNLDASLQKLVDVIRCDIVDLNKAHSVLKALESKMLSELSSHQQLMKHNSLIVVGLEYHMSHLVNDFRSLLESHRDQVVCTTQSSTPLSTSHHSSSYFSAPTCSVDPSFSPSPAVSQVSPPLPVSNTGQLSSPAVPFPNSYNSPRGLVESRSSSRLVNAPPHSGTNSHQPGWSSHSLLSPPTHTSRPGRSFIPVDESPVGMSEQIPLLHEQTQMQISDQQVRQRDASMKHVESTIVQLGEIYQQFSSLVMEQAEVVTRIDSNVEDTELNIGSAHEHLLAFLRSASARRSFMLKVFGVILICFIIFAWIR